MAIIAPFLVAWLGRKAVWLIALFPVVLFANYAAMVPEISRNEIITGGYQWVPALGVNFSWLIDGLSLNFALLITGIGALIIIYAGAYLKNHPLLGRFLAFILLFMGAMQGLVLSDSFLMLFVFWELTSIASFLLIGFDHKRQVARRAAFQALVVTGLGGLVLLTGLIVIWNITGVHEMSLLLTTGEAMRQSPFYLLALVLVLGGAFTKSAQFPFHFWLPNAMEAPTPVSAYLHSATMVKAGVYLLMRLNPVMGDTVEWQMILPAFGVATLATGALLAVRQTDLKLMLAHTTVASLGILVMLIGVGTEKAIAAATLYLIAHALFKGGLFMVAGAIDHEAGTRDIRKLSGLRTKMPVTFGIGLTLVFSMAGLLPFYGFIAKEEMYYALSDLWPLYALPLVILVLANALMFAVAFEVALRPFIGEKIAPPKPAHDGPIGLLAGPALLALCGLGLGVFWSSAHFYFASPTASTIAGKIIGISTGIIPKLNAALLLTFLTVAIGIIAYWQLRTVRAVSNRIFSAINWGPDRGFDQCVSSLVNMSVAMTKINQSGKLGYYIKTTFVVLACVFLLPLIVSNQLPHWPNFPSVRLIDWAMVLIAVTSIVAVVLAKDLLFAVLALGIQGFAVAVIYLLYGAPDLSFTQFMVETLSVVILALVITKLNLKAHPTRTGFAKFADFILASFVGIGATVLLLKVLETKLDMALPEFFAAFSYTIGHGRNIVNVILVDFRGVDTLGEIGVVMLAGLAVVALIKIRVASKSPQAKEWNQV